MARRPVCPPWQKAVILLSGVVCAAVTVALLSWGRMILMPMAVAVFLAFILSPIVRFLVRHRIPHGPAVVMTTTFAVLVSLGLVWGLTQQLASLTMTLPDHRERIIGKVTAIKAWASQGTTNRLGELVTEIESTVDPEPLSKSNPESVVGPGSIPKPEFEPAPAILGRRSGGWAGWAERFVSPAVEGIGQFAFAGVLVIFLLLKKEDLRDRFIRLAGDGHVTTTTKALDDASERVSRFLLKQFIFNMAFGVVVAVGLLLLHVQYALLWGALAAVMRYLPYVGTWIGVIPPTVYTLAVTDAWWPPLAVLVFILGLELVGNNLIEPFLYGQSLGVSEVAQLVAAGFWSFLWGPIGLILSGPLTTCFLVLGKYVPGLKFLDVILGNEPSLDRGTMFYQRLTARDDDAATRLFSETVAAEGIAVASDAVVLSALHHLKIAERDGDLMADAVNRCLNTIREIVDDNPPSAPPHTAVGTRPRLLIVPAKDEIDAVACELLVRLIPEDKWEVTVSASATLTGELVDNFEALAPDLVVVGSVRPGGLAHTRYLTKRILAKYSHLKLIIGQWGPSEAATPGEPIEIPAVTSTTFSLADTAVVVMGWRPTVIDAELSDLIAVIPMVCPPKTGPGDMRVLSRR